jgi:ribose transport system ATP-binding protein
LLPEERKTQALFSRMTIRENVTIAGLDGYARPRWGFISRRREREATAGYADSLRLKFAGTEAAITSLSGGNQQKVVLARLLDMGARILLLDEPTKGVDVGAKQEMFRLIQEFAAGGCGVLFISSDLEEVVELCDRALVMREGRIVGQVAGSQLTRAEILGLAYGHAASQPCVLGETRNPRGVIPTQGEDVE